MERGEIPRQNNGCRKEERASECHCGETREKAKLAMRLSRNTSIGVTPFCELPYRTNSVRFFNFISNRVQIPENSFCVKSRFLCLRTFLFG